MIERPVNSVASPYARAASTTAEHSTAAQLA